MKPSILVKLRKIRFEHANKKSAEVDSRSLEHLQEVISQAEQELLDSGVSRQVARLKVKHALVERSLEIVDLRDNYKPHSTRDKYVGFLDNIIEEHMNICNSLTFA